MVRKNHVFFIFKMLRPPSHPSGDDFRDGNEPCVDEKIKPVVELARKNGFIFLDT